MLHAIIMAGGSGTRFWPASRADQPKQLLNLASDRTMIQSTVDRLDQLVSSEHILIVTNERLVDAIRRQLPRIPREAVIGEPCKRDTAPCIGLAAGWIDRIDPEAIMVVMPSDHVIRSHDKFRAAIRHAVRLVEQRPSRLVTFGIRPTYPAESFGYIEKDTPLADDGPSDIPAFRVQRFHEKPRSETARKYMESGRFLWNSGIFVWRARTIFDLLRRFEPAMHADLAAIIATVGTAQFTDVFPRRFATIQGKSIDYAVMERAEDVVVIEAPFDWDDVGSWQSIARLRGQDNQGNTIVGTHLGIDTQGCIVRTTEDHLVVTIGMRDCIVVHTGDATLIVNKASEESVRDVVKQLEARGLSRFT